MLFLFILIGNSGGGGDEDMNVMTASFFGIIPFSFVPIQVDFSL